MERLNKDNFESRVLKNENLVLVDFYSDSCVPCKRMAPVLAELEESYAEKVYIGKVNSAYEPELIEKYSVRSAPTLIFFKDGEPFERRTGVVKKAELEAIINENL